MFEKFTESARQAVVKAQAEAQWEGHHHIGTEHLLIGVLREEDGLGAVVLNGLGVTLEDTRKRMLSIVPLGQGSAPTFGCQLTLTPHAKMSFEFAEEEAQALGHNFIGPEHELLGLIRDAEIKGDARQGTGIRGSVSADTRYPDDKRSIVADVIESFEIEAEQVASAIKKVWAGDIDYLRELRAKGGSSAG